MQNHYSLLYREEEREMIPYCRATGVGIIPWAPLARGHLARPPASTETSVRKDMEKQQAGSGFFEVGASDTDKAIVKRVQEVAGKVGWRMATVALVWVGENVTSPIVGLSSVQRVREMEELKEKKLDEAHKAYLEELYVPRTISGHI
jgi:aryl-alcohol dehydrogenase-like predicted oxidoreductase